MTMHDDPYDLERFGRAQEGMWEQALREIHAGQKRSHWMWFVFPQAEGLGRSEMARRYAIRSLGETRAYLAHPILGPRLVEASEAAAAVPKGNARAVFGTPDDMKLCSSATLFAAVAAEESAFRRVLKRYFEGEHDAATVRWVARQSREDAQRAASLARRGCV